MSQDAHLDINAEGVPPQPWRNGGGQTRELLTWPSGADWQVRISRADIESGGPFSAFPGVHRWFCVLEGAGVTLDFGGARTSLRCGDDPIDFDGALAPLCTLLEGPTQDLNLMLRNGRGCMQSATVGKPWPALFTFRGLYTREAGMWSNGIQSRPLAAHTLVWSHGDNNFLWTFMPDTSTALTPAWWLGFTPFSS
jgi:environmental stress-induced protein Ves